MKLVKAHITNYRSVLDTGEFTLSGTTCLVGKNESGKTTLLQALERLNPYDSTKKCFNRDLEYPRGYLAEYASRHGDDEAEVISTVWELSEQDIAAVEAELGPQCLASTAVTVAKTYGSETTTWVVVVNEALIVSNLLTRFGIKQAEKKQLSLSTVREFVAKVKDLGAGTSEEAKAAAAQVSKFRDGSATKAAIDILHARMPKFLYFSSFDRMDGRVHLETLQNAKAQGLKIKPGQQIFQDFLDFAGTSVEELTGNPPKLAV